jgi:hypothetical protein
MGWVTLVDSEGRDAIALFTKEENAEAYIQATRLEEKVVLVPIRNLGILIDFFGFFLETGFAETIALDRTTKIGDGQCLDLREFVTNVREAINKRCT